VAIYKRGRVYWYQFVFNNQRVQCSTKQGNPRVARQIEAAHKTRLAKGEVGLSEPKTMPTLREFGSRFQAEIRVHCAGKPRTVAFWEQKLMRLLEFMPLASAPLDKIKKALIARYVQKRQGNVAVATINRELATLRRILYLAHDWNEIAAVPRIKMLQGERIRDFVLSHQQEKVYLDAAPQPLRDVPFFFSKRACVWARRSHSNGQTSNLILPMEKCLAISSFVKGNRRTPAGMLV